MSYEDYPIVDVLPVGETRIINPTYPGQLAMVPHGSDTELDLVRTVHSHLPAHKQTQDSFQALMMCLAQAPHDFAGIARKYGVGPTEITINNQQHHHLANNQQYHLSRQDYHQFQPQFTPTYSPTIEFNPVINVDANALARSYSQQDNSGSGDNSFWKIIFIAILGVAVVTTLGGGK